ncbi:MAG: phosphoribosylformylglycinamidine synthase [Epsilonproteobacteria bacterium]|jgi:phosphoribosylformylglycinamidine synthase|nr:phosphoribosylformylglycinamidine synthase [Campylobacterota bacterium]NPA88809.1 phosphoribosylformylglycinamidine synthase subunit PurS [Campylobacterota bacterium]
MKAIVNVHLKKGVLDPQGKAVHHALENLGFKNVEDVRIGKQILIELKAQSVEEAEKEVKEMADRLLANPVIENYTVEILQ